MAVEHIQLRNNNWEHFGAFHKYFLILPMQQFFEIGPLITIAQRVKPKLRGID